MLSSPENQQDRARVEALRLQEAVDIAEWAERRVEDAVKYVALENSRKQGARQQSIEKLRKQIRALEERVSQEEEEHTKTSEMERNRQKLAKEKAAEARAARVKAERELQEHPYINALNYSRKCPVCLNTNPPRRAVMVACGHILCNLCADELQKTTTSNEPTPKVSCPLCRKETTYVKVFEDLQTPQVCQGDARETRKRTADASLQRDCSPQPRTVNLSTATLSPLRSHSPNSPNRCVFARPTLLFGSRAPSGRSPLDPSSISLYGDVQNVRPSQSPDLLSESDEF